MDNSIKFVWAHLIKKGIITTGEWSNFAGWKTVNEFDHDADYLAMKNLRAKILDIGVDWEVTGNPITQEKPRFIDTYYGNEDVEALSGILVLKDGSSYRIGCEGESFGAFLKLINQYLNDKDIITDTFGNR